MGSKTADSSQNISIKYDVGALNRTFANLHSFSKSLWFYIQCVSLDCLLFLYISAFS